MTTPLLQVEGIEARYGKVTALRDVSVHVDAQEIVSIIGPNGAGKTTLLSVVAGLVRPARGRVTFDGQDVSGGPLEETVRRGIALVPEGRHVFASLTVMENLSLGATIRTDRQGVEQDIESHLESFPILRQRAHSPAGLLSGGEQQMLVIARALLSRPRLLMLDEPSLGLAPKVTAQVYDTVARIREEGVTVLVVEQNAGRALAVADRTYVLSGAEVRLSGKSAELENDAAFETAYFGLSEGAES